MELSKIAAEAPSEAPQAPADDTLRPALFARYTALEEEIPVGILYRNPSVPCYDELRAGERPSTPALVETVLNEEFDKVGIWPGAASAAPGME